MNTLKKLWAKINPPPGILLLLTWVALMVSLAVNHGVIREQRETIREQDEAIHQQAEIIEKQKREIQMWRDARETCEQTYEMLGCNSNQAGEPQH